MRSFSGLFEQLCTRQALTRACQRAARGKRRVPEVAGFLFRQEEQLVALEEALTTGSYRPGPFRSFVVLDPKPRLITCAPFRDRVVHQALVGVLEPCFRPGFIDQSFACLSGRGTHHALLYHCGLMRQFRFLMMVDIRKYFLSIPHARLLALLERHLREPSMRWLIRCLLDHEQGLYLKPGLQAVLGDPGFVPELARGISIGTLTSQFYGNLYLNGLDHFIKRKLKVAGYLRYMDNGTLFADDRPTLREHLKRVQDFVETRLGLTLSPRSGRIVSCQGSLDYLGHRVSREGIRPGKRMLQRLKRRMLSWRSGPLTPEQVLHIRRSLISVRGLMAW